MYAGTQARGVSWKTLTRHERARERETRERRNAPVRADDTEAHVRFSCSGINNTRRGQRCRPPDHLFKLKLSLCSPCPLALAPPPRARASAALIISAYLCFSVCYTGHFIIIVDGRFRGTVAHVRLYTHTCRHASAHSPPCALWFTTSSARIPKLTLAAARVLFRMQALRSFYELLY